MWLSVDSGNLYHGLSRALIKPILIANVSSTTNIDKKILFIQNKLFPFLIEGVPSTAV